MTKKAGSGEFTNPGDSFIRFYNKHLPNSYFLSNFYETPVTVKAEQEDLTFRCTEAAFQALRCESHSDTVEFTPLDGHSSWQLAQRKKEAQKILRNRERDLAVMKEVVLAKFSQSEELKDQLLATQCAYLVERSRKTDKFWGDGLQDGIGENHLGIILMEVREELGGVGVVEKPQEYIDFVKTYPKHW